MMEKTKTLTMISTIMPIKTEHPLKRRRMLPTQSTFFKKFRSLPLSGASSALRSRFPSPSPRPNMSWNASSTYSKSTSCCSSSSRILSMINGWTTSPSRSSPTTASSRLLGRLPPSASSTATRSTVLLYCSGIWTCRWRRPTSRASCTSPSSRSIRPRGRRRERASRRSIHWRISASARPTTWQELPCQISVRRGKPWAIPTRPWISIFCMPRLWRKLLRRWLTRWGCSHATELELSKRRESLICYT
mmetsp:Transcript_3471/g.7964  ORF Transcript_3471/g.7964 Transcript_3471/m.7964 type:complete len:247 (-) Transcript_3471:243-983(-)